MKFNRLIVGSALLAGYAFMGCSGGQDDKKVDGVSSVGFNLRTIEGVVITSVSYDLNTGAGADVLSGTIPVPNDNSVINGTLDAIPVGSYSLVLTATGSYNGEAVDCASQPTTFSLAANQNLTLSPAINLVCTIDNVIADDSATVSFVAGVTVEQIDVVRRIVETFGVTPNSVIASVAGTTCTFPPINISVNNTNPSISYSWSSSPADGTFALNAANTSGTYTCGSNGTKTLTVTAALGSATANRSVTVTCSGCDISTGPTCGDGIVTAPETCDESTPRCVACTIVPVCGDSIIDAPETCDHGGTPTATCNATCQTVAAGPTCGDGIVEAPETCDHGGTPTATCNAACQTVTPPADVCGDCIAANADIGPLQTELCDADPLCTAVQECVLDAGCYSPIPANCYCGSDIDNCETPSFVPVGPCAATIRAAAGTDNPDNATLLERYFSFDYPVGIGLSIIDEATRVCTAECGFSTP